MTYEDGWHQLPSTTRAHYFRDRRALCGRWILAEPFEPEHEDAHHCLACERKAAS